MKKVDKAVIMKLFRKITIIASVSILILIVIFLVAFYWRGSTKPIEAVANKFQPPSSWVLESEDIEPPNPICLDGSCPGLQRTWVQHDSIKFDELASLIKKAGWKINESTCPTSNDESVKNNICLISMSYSGYLIQLSINLGGSSVEETTVTMNIAKDHNG